MPVDVTHILKGVGWYPQRRVDLPPSLVKECPPEHPALAILSNFGGLHVGSSGSGIECARSDVRFVWLGHDFDDNIAPWEALLLTKLVGVGEVHNHHTGLYVAQDGRCFGLSLIHDAFSFEGVNIGEALQRFLDGMRSRPMLRPDQEEVDLYGMAFSRHSPEIYKY